MKRQSTKSFFAVVVGFLSVAVFSITTDSLLEKIGIFPPSSSPDLYMIWMLVLALFYRSLYTVVGGYITAKLAPYSSMRHVYILMILGGIGGVAGAIGGWDMGNHWYPVLLAATGPLFVWVGGKLHTRT
jgi:hypothetical protein